MKTYNLWVILFVLAFTISLTAASSDYPPDQDSWDELGYVNGEPITAKIYNARIQEIIERYQQQGQKFNDSMMPQIQYIAWDELVNEKLWNQQVNKYRIQVSEWEIKHAMENDIPQDIVQNEHLHTNGIFDKNKFIDALNNIPEFKAELYNYMEVYLPRKKLQDKIKHQAGITADSLVLAFIHDTDSVSGKAIWFDYNLAAPVHIPAEEVAKYYYENRDSEFKKGPASRIKYLSLEITPSYEDFIAAKPYIYDIYYRLLFLKESFSDLAQEFSEDPGSATQGGSLGSFDKGQMVPEFDTVVFNLKVGGISKPFKSPFGWHIARCDQILSTKPGEEKIVASHILISVKTSDATRERLREQADLAAKLIKTKDIEAVASDMNLEVNFSPWLMHNEDYIDGIGQHQGLSKFIKTGQPGSVSEVFHFLHYPEKLILAQIIDNVQSYYEDLESVQAQISSYLEKKKKIASAKVKAEEFVKNVSQGSYLKAAWESGWKIIDLEDHKRESSIPTVNAVNDDFSRVALALNPGEYSPLVITSEGPFIIYVEARNKPDLRAFCQDKAQQDEIRNRLENSAFNRWWQNLRKEAIITDNRYLHGY